MNISDPLHPIHSRAFLEDGSYKHDAHGFVVDLRGNIFHLREPYTHGVVLACLEPEKCIEFCLPIPPTQGHCNVYDYQAFEMQETKQLGYITFSDNPIATRLSYKKGAINEDQVKALEKYFKNHPYGYYLESKIITDYELDKYLKDVLASMKGYAYNNRIGKLEAPIVIKPENVIEPDYKGLGV